MAAEIERATFDWDIRAHPSIDTLKLAKQRFPGQGNSLDALVRRFKIDVGNQRLKHGAYVDSEILARVYFELTGGRQQVLSPTLFSGQGMHIPDRPDDDPPGGDASDGDSADRATHPILAVMENARLVDLTTDDEARHRAFCEEHSLTCDL
jgi:DNA polymerase-3 subunit epsilon